MLKLVNIQVRLLHAYQNKCPEGFAATSLDEIKMLIIAGRLSFRIRWILHGIEHKVGSGDGGIEINCGRTEQAIRPSS